MTKELGRHSSTSFTVESVGLHVRIGLLNNRSYARPFRSAKCSCSSN